MKPSPSMFRALFAAVLAVGFGCGGTGLLAQSLVRVSVTPGPAYVHKVTFGIIPLTLLPQMAIWIETEDGRFVDTIYVTEKSATARGASGLVARPGHRCSPRAWNHEYTRSGSS